MNLFLGKIEGLSKPKIMIFTFIMFVSVLVMVNVVFVPDFKYLTQTLRYTPEKAYQMLDSYGGSGRAVHLRVLIADIAMVVLYSIFFSTAIFLTFRRFIKSRTLLSLLCLTPFLLAIIQTAEVIGIFTLLVHYPKKMFSLARVTSSITVIKFILTYICFLMPVIGLLGLLIKKAISKVSPTI